MAKYQRLTVSEREEISREIASGVSLRAISRTLNRSPSTISREINRCVVDRKFYRSFFAQQRSNKTLHQIHTNKKLNNNKNLRKVVFFYLRKKWSPEQIAKEFKHLPKGLKRTLTYDQGSEMAEHRIFTKETEIEVYFVHPSSPWEQGTNGLLRQYFPKGTDFTNISKSKLKAVQDELNDRPRKALEWSTPHEKFSELLR